MKVILFANNRVGWQVTEYLAQSGDAIAGLVIHPEAKRRYGAEIVKASGVPPERVFDGSTLTRPETLDGIRSLGAEMGVSILFDYIMKPELISIFPKGVVNLHPAYLPYNRGQYPNVWSIVEGTPSGVTLHYIDAGVDTGAIIAQAEVPVLAADTGETLYKKLERESADLFKKTWPLLKAGRARAVPQKKNGGSYHRTSDAERIDAIDLNKTYKAADLINILRARTFPPYKGAYFTTPEGKKVYLRLSLEEEGKDS